MQHHWHPKGVLLCPPVEPVWLINLTVWWYAQGMPTPLEIEKKVGKNMFHQTVKLIGYRSFLIIDGGSGMRSMFQTNKLILHSWSHQITLQLFSKGFRLSNSPSVDDQKTQPAQLNQSVVTIRDEHQLLFLENLLFIFQEATFYILPDRDYLQTSFT